VHLLPDMHGDLRKAVSLNDQLCDVGKLREAVRNLFQLRLEAIRCILQIAEKSSLVPLFNVDQ